MSVLGARRDGQVNQLSQAGPFKVGKGVDWGKLGPLRLRARLLADGLYAGSHKSRRRGSGIEFDGFREYSPGDDVRWLDRRALLLRDRPLVRQFETETDRVLRLLVDATLSMQYAGKRALGSKYAYASLLAAAMARLSALSGDPVGLSYLGGALQSLSRVPVSGGREAYHRVVSSLENTAPGGDAQLTPHLFAESLENLARTARRGSIVLIFSDGIDLPKGTAEALADLAHVHRQRRVVFVRLLDPDEEDFPFEGGTLFRAYEGNLEIESDQEMRAGYIESLLRHTAAQREVFVSRGARFLTALTGEDPAEVLLRIAATVS
jgi:uncharacterized protein (DUF58 family)